MEFAELIRDGRAKAVGFVRHELLSGIKSNEQYERLKLYLRAFQDELLDTSDYEDAAKASNRYRAKGIVVSIVDVLLCRVTVRRCQSTFATDTDFLALRQSATPSRDPRAAKIAHRSSG